MIRPANPWFNLPNKHILWRSLLRNFSGSLQHRLRYKKKFYCLLSRSPHPRRMIDYYHKHCIWHWITEAVLENNWIINYIEQSSYLYDNRRSQEPTTGLYPEPDESSSHKHTSSLRTISKWSLTFYIRRKTNLFLFYFIILVYYALEYPNKQNTLEFASYQFHFLYR